MKLSMYIRIGPRGWVRLRRLRRNRKRFTDGMTANGVGKISVTEWAAKTRSLSSPAPSFKWPPEGFDDSP